MEAFVQHLLHDVLAKKTVDKVIRLIRKLHWEDQEVRMLRLGSSSTTHHTITPRSTGLRIAARRVHPSVGDQI